jgi:hypothetical protein
VGLRLGSGGPSRRPKGPTVWVVSPDCTGNALASSKPLQPNISARERSPFSRIMPMIDWKAVIDAGFRLPEGLSQQAAVDELTGQATVLFALDAGRVARSGTARRQTPPLRASPCAVRVRLAAPNL